MGSQDETDEEEIKKTPILKPGRGTEPGDLVAVKAEFDGETLRHRHRLASWKLMGINGGDIDLDGQNEAGLIIKVEKYTISPQKTENYLFVDEIVEQFDSSIVDDMIEPITQDIEKAREQASDRIPSKPYGGWMSNINRRKL